MTPRFSIITVCFNAEATIESTIRSLEIQTCRDFEYLIIDGASSDGTLTVAKNALQSEAVVVSEPDGGIYDAMNKGLSLARGEIIYFLNADDQLLDATVLQRVSEAFERSGEPDLLWGNVIYRYPDKKIVRRFRHIRKSNLIFLDLNHQATFAKRTLFSQVGNFDLRFRLNADYDFLLRAMNSGIRYSSADIDVAVFNAGGRHVQDVKFLRQERENVRFQYISPRKYRIGAFAYNFIHKLNYVRKLILPSTR